MKLIACRIENFGKLSNLELNFRDGCNTICAENGWGKSTLAVFLKVMFYGFANESKRSNLENERKRYKPWQGGVYGGSLTFQTGRKQYVVTRIFGEKEKEDTFELYDAETNLVSKDFSNNIGEELFQIDAASFKRTVFVLQNDCRTQTTDRVNAKLGNISEYTDDINRFEIVNMEFRDWLNAMSPTRKTGILFKENEKLKALETELLSLHTVEEAIVNLEVAIARQKDLREQYRIEQQTLQRRQQELSLEKDRQALCERYTEYFRDENERKLVYEREKEWFSGKISQETYKKHFADEQALDSTIEKHISEWNRILERQQTVQNQETVLQTELAKFSHQMLELQQEKKQQKAEAKQREAEEKRWKKMNRSKDIAIFLILLIVGILGSVIASVEIGMIGSIVGIVFALVGMLGYYCLVMKRSVYSYDTEADLVDLKRMEQDIKTYHQAIENCQRKLETLEQKRCDLTEEKKAVFGYLATFGIHCTEEAEVLSCFYDLKMELQKYHICEQEWRRAKERLDLFEQQNPNIKAYMETVNETAGWVSWEESDAKSNETESLAALHDMQNQLTGQLETVEQTLQVYNRQLEEMRQKQEWLAEQQAYYEQLKLQYDEKMRKYRQIEKTKQFMEDAKVRFTSKYMEPLRTGFQKYYHMITKQTGDAYILDANSKLLVKEQGRLHESEFMSAGCQDLNGICMRMALVDAMYVEEKPFVLLDDPFVNLDDRNLEGALAVLQEIGTEYQVLYFTCHEGRLRNNAINDTLLY